MFDNERLKTGFKNKHRAVFEEETDEEISCIRLEFDLFIATNVN